MGVTFWKMHGAGNDFILIDDRSNQFPADDKGLIEKLCQRRTGIGCEGLILIRTSTVADFYMRFFNPNGNEADMCGNGARCIARLAYDMDIADATMKFETRAGIIAAEVNGDSVKLHLPPATNHKKNKTITLDTGEEINYDFLNTGVPHAVVQTNNLKSYPVKNNGHAIIKHKAFAPEETNVNFAEIVNPHHINIRTYERGVEDETLACGTGITATAIIMALRGLVHPPVSVKAASGDILTVDFTINDNCSRPAEWDKNVEINTTIENITLTGPATYVFSGKTKTTFKTQ